MLRLGGPTRGIVTINVQQILPGGIGVVDLGNEMKGVHGWWELGFQGWWGSTVYGVIGWGSMVVGSRDGFSR